MYDELIKRLRYSEHEISCSLCDRDCCYPDGKVHGKCIIIEAADAIEELKNNVEQYKLYLQDAIKDLQSAHKELPRWIPVTERLPEDGIFVLVCNDDGHMMIAKHETETYEWYYKYTNYDFDIWDNEEQGPVCYWMPLPEPPKEE